MTEPAETAPTSTDDAPEPSDGDGGQVSLAEQLEQAKAEADKWKKRSRTNEDRAKANAAAAKELDDVRKQAMTDQERAVAEAAEQATARTRAEMAGTLVAAKIEAAAAQTGLDIGTIVQGIDPAKFLTDEGTVDDTAITAFVGAMTPEPAQPAPAPTFGDFGQSSSRSDDNALNGDPLYQKLVKAVGART